VIKVFLIIMLSYEVYLRHHEWPLYWLKNEFSAHVKYLMYRKLYFSIHIKYIMYKKSNFLYIFSKRLVYASDYPA